MKIRIVRLLAAAAAAAAALSASLATTGAAAAPKVVADIGPVHGLVARVMQGVGVPRLLLPPGVSPHDYQMRPSEGRALAEADLVFWIGPALTPWLERSLGTLAADARATPLLETPGAVRLPLPDGDDHDHGHGHGHDQGHDQGSEPEADHAAVDPHAWLDPENGARWMAVIAGELAAADPANAAAYRANAAAGAADLTALTARIREKLAAAGDRPLLVFHDAYRYFEARFGLAPVAALLSGDAERPGAKRLADVSARVRAVGGACVLVEPQFSPRLIAAVVGQDAETVEIDPIGAAIAPGPNFYSTLLERVADGFARCLG